MDILLTPAPPVKRLGIGWNKPDIIINMPVKI